MKRITTDPWKFLQRIKLYLLESKRQTLSLDDMEYPNYPDNCWTLDVAKQTNGTPTYIAFTFKPSPIYSAEVSIEDRLISLKRASTFSKFSQTGPTLSTTAADFKGYALEIDQEISDEGQTSFGGKNYPTEEYSSYQDCDSDFVRKYVKDHTTNWIPVWASESPNLTTTYSNNVKVNKSFDGWKFIVGNRRTECSLPCTTTKISAR